MDFTEVYNTLNYLNLVDKDDIILYLSSQKNIVEKIHRKRRDLQSIFYLYDDKIRSIQRFLKYVLFRNRIKDIIATIRRNSDYYTNTETLLGVPLQEIKSEHFFSYNQDGFNYAFDIRELDKLIDYKLTNPYNTKNFPKDIVRQVKRLMRNKNFGDILAYIQMSIPLNSNESAKIASVFNKLTSLYVYPDIRKFLNFTGKQYLYFIQDLRTNVLINKHIPPYQYDLLVDIHNENNIARTRRVVLDILLKVLSIKDINTYTRALIVSEQIENTINSDSDDSDDSTDDSNNNNNISSSLIRTTNPLFIRRANTRRRQRRLLRLGSNTTFPSFPLRRTGPPLRPPPVPPAPPAPPAPPMTPAPPIVIDLVNSATNIIESSSISAPPRTPPARPPGINSDAQLYANILADTENIINSLDSNTTINDVRLSDITDSIQTQIDNLINRINNVELSSTLSVETRANDGDEEDIIIFNSEENP